jgi:hypothetical protein
MGNEKGPADILYISVEKKARVTIRKRWCHLLRWEKREKTVANEVWGDRNQEFSLGYVIFMKTIRHKCRWSVEFM